MSRLFSTSLLVASLLCAPAALADTPRPGPGAGGGGGAHFDYHGQDFRGLGPADRDHWGRGEWRNVWHDGVFGWWWYLDDYWYYYPQPVYPYPTYIAPVVPPAPPAVWYRCANPAGFYPYVPACPGGWQTVPMTPPPGPPPA
jgi:hypothetical protein